MSTDFENALSNQLPPPPAEIPYIPTPEELADWREIEQEIMLTMR